MTFSSMTGFARHAGEAAGHRFVWELKTVNAKSLDIRLRMSPGFDDVGEEARRRMGGALKRGTCFVSLNMTRDQRAPAVRINEGLLDQLVALADKYRGRDGLNAPSLDGLLAVRGVVEIDEAADEADSLAALRKALLTAFDNALAELQSMRLSEGAALQKILTDKIDEIAALTEAAEQSPARQPEAIRKKIATQIAAILETGRGFDENRLHQEAILLASRADVREELDRLRTHVVAVRELLNDGGAVGRKLDFLAQELGREASTLSAKASDAALNATGLALKSAVEQFREQVQNVE
ncbi:MAG: YicC/YloC family endoribonuclease [Beijerinckiaceae bacterium]